MNIPTQNCVACGACMSVCPHGAITIVQNESGFYMPQIHKDTCVQCGLCQKVCPVAHRPKGTSWESSHFYALWDTDPAKRREGSSGGAFGLLAESILTSGGVVFGAAYTEDWHRVHQIDTDHVPLSALKKSKYVESYTGDIFCMVRTALETGRAVLYCGTACQIDGLLAYLPKTYTNLLTCDLLCHGVPAAGVYTKYIRELEARYGKITSVDFRSKAYGWRAYCSRIRFASGKTYCKTKYQDPYLRIFFANTALRESCYSCDRLCSSTADITLGDFWQVRSVPTIPDTNEGVSLVCVHTEKGRWALEQLLRQNRCYHAELPKESYTYAYTQQHDRPKDREHRLEEILHLPSLWQLPCTPQETRKGQLYYIRAVAQKLHGIIIQRSRD